MMVTVKVKNYDNNNNLSSKQNIARKNFQIFFFFYSSVVGIKIKIRQNVLHFSNRSETPSVNIRLRESNIRYDFVSSLSFESIIGWRVGTGAGVMTGRISNNFFFARPRDTRSHGSRPTKSHTPGGGVLTASANGQETPARTVTHTAVTRYIRRGLFTF